MQRNPDEYQHVSITLTKKLYTAYKIALLSSEPRQNTTQDIIAHIRAVVETHTKALEKKKEEE